MTDCDLQDHVTCFIIIIRIITINMLIKENLIIIIIIIVTILRVSSYLF